MRRSGATAEQGLARRIGRPTRARRRENSSSLTEQVYQLLRAEILSCVLEPGQDISEAELAARFQVSKTPVREALATLRADGFVRAFPRRGYQIAPITLRDMNELFELRGVLEAGAAELACRRIGEDALAGLGILADVTYDRAERPSLKPFIRANREFHVAIARAAGNARLYQQLVKTMDELERFFYLGARLRDVSGETTSDHHKIVAALRSREGERARAAMIQHNEVTRRGLAQLIASSQELDQVGPWPLKYEVNVDASGLT
jgi:DNA-binding GntR family transcriptional regulator